MATSLGHSASIWVLLRPSRCPLQGLRDSCPAPVISSRPQGGLGFSKDPANMPQNEPNFCVGLKSDLVPLGGPRIDPEVQNHCHLWLPRTGCLSAVDEPNSQSTCCHQQFVPLWALLSKEPATDCIPAPISTAGHEGAALQWDWETRPSLLQESAREEPRPLGFLGNNIPPPPYSHSLFTPTMKGKRKKPTQ